MSQERTVFKSAFGHSLRSSAPIPVPEHLQHFTTAVLQGQYTFKVGKNEENGRLCLELALPAYSEEGFVEGLVVLEEGVEMDEQGAKMLEQLKATTSPCGMMCQNSRGALKTMFDELAAKSLSADTAISSVKKQSAVIVKSALEKLQIKSELVQGRTIVEMDALIAEAESEILRELLSLAGENAGLKEYLESAIQLHQKLELDDTIDSDPAMGCCGGGGCCGEGEGGCCDDVEEHEEEGGCCDHGHDDHHHHHHHDHGHGHGGCCDHGH
jgi:hypothetical protein